MQASVPVAVVVVSYNSGDALFAALKSARRAGARQRIVIDNDSKDDAVQKAQRVDPHLIVRRQKTNTGFAAACNVGLSLATQNYVLFLNDDATIEPDYLCILCEALSRDPQAVGAIGKLLQRNEPAPRIDSAGIDWRPWSWSAKDRGANAIDAGQFDARARPFGITGAAAVYRRDVLLKAGGYDERLVSYYEDVDLAWRLTRLGYHHLYEPTAVAYHARRGLVGKQRDIQLRAHLNRYRVWCRYETPLRFFCHLPIALPREMLRAARLAARDPSLAKAVYGRVPGQLQRGFSDRRQ